MSKLKQIWQKNKTLITILFVIMVLWILAQYLGTSKERYHYFISDFEKNAEQLVLAPGKTYSQYILAKLYNEDNQHIGEVASVNHHQIIGDKNHVTTLTTYITPNGTITCNIYYTTKPDDNYLYGIVENIVTENETGMYKGKKVVLHIDGKLGGKRVLSIDTSSKWF